MRKLILSLLCLSALSACENKAYDTEKLVTEVSLLEGEISVPIGNIGPFTLDLALKSETIGTILGAFIETEEDGTLLGKVQENMYTINVYEIIAKTKDMSEPFTYPLPDQEFTPGTLAGLLQSYGFHVVDQHVTLLLNNPLTAEYTISGETFVSCLDTRTYETRYSQKYPLENHVIRRGFGSSVLLDTTIPDTVHFSPSGIGIQNISLQLPAHMDEKLNAREFIFGTRYSNHLAAGEDAEIPLDMFGLRTVTVNVKLPIRAYRFKEVEVSLDVENTLPLQVTLSNVRLFTGEKPAVDENLVVSPETTVVKGGSLDNPATTPVTLKLRALEGTIPDITSIRMDLSAQSAPGFADTRLSAKQGIRVQSASATLRGGITLGGK